MSKPRTLDARLVSLTAPASFAAEQYQGLRLTVERLARSREMKVLAISSPAAGDGKTLTAINLAGALARGDDGRVLLIDADLRRPAITRQLAIAEPRKGLADALSRVAAGPRLGAMTSRERGEVRTFITGVDADGRSCVVSQDELTLDQLAPGFAMGIPYATTTNPPPARRAVAELK